jgi:hypothetical protein
MLEVFSIARRCLLGRENPSPQTHNAEEPENTMQHQIFLARKSKTPRRYVSSETQTQASSEKTSLKHQGNLQKSNKFFRRKENPSSLIHPRFFAKIKKDI